MFRCEGRSQSPVLLMTEIGGYATRTAFDLRNRSATFLGRGTPSPTTSTTRTPVEINPESLNSPMDQLLLVQVSGPNALGRAGQVG